MAKIKTPSYIKTPGGKMGDAVLYSIGNRTFMRTYVIPRNPRTEVQQKNRSLFAEAMASWKSLSSEEKNLYKIRTRGLSMRPHNLFISEYMALHSDRGVARPDSSLNISDKTIRKAESIYSTLFNPPISLHCHSEASPLSLQKSLSSSPLLHKTGSG